MPFTESQIVYWVDGVTVKEARVAKDGGANAGLSIYTSGVETVSVDRKHYFASEREALEARIAVIQEKVDAGEGNTLADLQTQLAAINHPPTAQEGE